MIVLAVIKNTRSFVLGENRRLRSMLVINRLFVALLCALFFLVLNLVLIVLAIF